MARRGGGPGKWRVTCGCQRSRPKRSEAQESIWRAFSSSMIGQRYQYLIELGRQLPPFPETAQVEGNRIHGCQSGVWLVCDYRNGRLEFAATSDSAIVAGIITLLLQVYSGRQPQQVLATTPIFVEEIGLSTHLSPHRANGLALMLERIRAFATAHASEDFAEDEK